MRTLLAASSLLLLTLGQFAHAQQTGADGATLPAYLNETPSFRNGILKIPSVTLIDELVVGAYREVILVEGLDGRFTLVEVHDGELAEVDSVSVDMGAATADHITVTVTGTKSTACVYLLPPSITQDGNNVTIALPVSRTTDTTCVQVVEPFETTILLPTENQAPGVYRLAVNSVATTVTLE